MGVVHESFLAWRIKFLIPAVVILLMLISVLRRHILPLFFALLVVFSLAAPSSAATWNDVVIAWGAHTPGAGCFDFVTSYQQNGQTGYQLWKRCGGTSLKTYSKQFVQGHGPFSRTSAGQAIHLCDGLGGRYNLDGTTEVFTYTKDSSFMKDFYCDGHTVQGSTEYSGGGSHSYMLASCDDGIKPEGSNPVSCSTLDTLISDFFPVANDCQYTGAEVFGAGGNTGMTYYSHYADDGTVNVCNQCIPAGMIPSSNSNHNTPLPADPSQYRCYWQDVIGDPAALVPVAPSLSGSGSSGSTGGYRPGAEVSVEDSSTTTTSISDGTNTETTTTTTNTTVNPDGTSTETKTSALSYCVDLNSDGISDLSGRKCDETITETTTSSSYDVIPKTAYSNGSLPEVGNFGSLFTDFAADVRATQLFSTFSLSGLAPVGSGSSSYTLDFGSYGTHNFNLANYSTALNIIKGFMLLLASYLAVRVVVLKR